MADLKRPLIALLVLLALAAAIYAASLYLGSPSEDAGASIGMQKNDAPPPPPTPEVLAYLAESTGFQYLVSYTDRGFEPAGLSIKKGETVRFTNNSGEGLWVAATGTSGRVYPGDEKGCGQSVFDSCRVLQPGEFWEFTFERGGTWSYQNNSDAQQSGVVTVE